MTNPIANPDIRNIAIIAHVDHGKTTLVDGLLKQTGFFRATEQIQERILDTNDLERERGITIFSKNISVIYQGVKINIVDTPGHADFGGEVERILRMVDGVLLLVDAFEGPMPQTRFVLRKALHLALHPVVVINKVDRPNCSPLDVLDKVYDLFIDLNASDSQLDFPVLFTSARDGYAVADMKERDAASDLRPLLDTIVTKVPPPVGDGSAPFQMLITKVEYDDYIKKVAVGRIANGTVNLGDTVVVFSRKGERRTGKVAFLFDFQGLERRKVERAMAGDIVAVAGIEEVTLGETIASALDPRPLPVLEVDRPTLSLKFAPNTSPLSGRDGSYVTSRQIRERLFFEARNNLALRVEETDRPEVLKVSGRGELHLAILIETMRREGYELEIGKPEVILDEIDGVTCEPFEYLIIEVPDEHSGVVIERAGRRKGVMVRMAPVSTESATRLEFEISTRGLLGLRSELLTETRGTLVMHHSFHEYRPFSVDLKLGRRRGAMVSKESGPALSYALNNLQERGTLFVYPGMDLYEGMVIGENSRDNDLDVNPCKGKHLTNIRAAGSDEKIILTPARILSLEQALEFINEDELVEVTPKSIRLRKRILDCTKRRVSARETRASTGS
ncbi:MAG: translational GTPase TypA [Candidatus Riflebacteria bacterium]|nr:translational GTPase TypA [Candidatus Riflebacteria bacterium]